MDRPELSGLEDSPSPLPSPIKGEGVLDQSRVVTEHRTEPFFQFGYRHAFALGEAFDLIFLHFAYVEVFRLRVREVPAGDGGGGPHGVVFGERDADAVFGVEQLE